MKSTVAVDVSFGVLKHALSKQFELMKEHGLYRVDLSGAENLSPEQRAAATGNALWDQYLDAFPEGTNPIYRERTEHDCQCCRQFVRTMGGVVTIVGGALVSIWDNVEVSTPELGFYREVMDEMATFVRDAPIDNIFLHTEKTVGAEKTFMQSMDIESTDSKGRPLGPQVTTKTWEHFHIHLPTSCVVSKDNVGPKLSETRATYDVLKRGLEELTLDAFDTVLELIAQNSLYRGEEQKGAVTAFRALKVEYGRTPFGAARNVFCWHLVRGGSPTHSTMRLDAAVLRIRNTAVGTLLQDLSEGKDLDVAVGAFERIMAPANYKRPTALVTKAMIEKARVTIEDLGFTSALERRYATKDDVTVNNVLFVDRNVTSPRAYQQAAVNSVLDSLASKIPEKLKNLDRVEEIHVDVFLANVLPRAESLEVMFENRHASNLVSLIAPVDPGAKNMFKWPNNFSWSYTGEVADSIKERVKKAGGSVVGDLCCRLAWDYSDDLDFHMAEPGRGLIYYGNRRQTSPCGGVLDLDANGADGPRADPAENIVYASRLRMPEGVYKLSVNNYQRRSTGVGFDAEVEFDGVVHSFSYPLAIPTGATVVVAEIAFTRKDGFKILTSLPSSQTAKTIWGATTGTFHKVNMVMLSPNYWEGSEPPMKKITRTKTGEPFVFGVGNRHLFFMLEGCKNEDKARGFFNEFLSSELEPHRKTMEMVGAKMRTDNSDQQLSGLGFSSTKHDSVMVRVKGSFNRVIKVVL